MLRIFKSSATNLTVMSSFEYKTSDGNICASATETNSPVKKAKDFDNLYQRLEKTLDAFKPKERACELKLTIAVSGKANGVPVDVVFNDMNAYRQFLVDNKLVKVGKPTLTK